MPIQFPPNQRTIVLCDYAAGGFRHPEMVKRRPAIVLTGRLPHRDNLCAVVPMSGSEPEHPVRYVVRIELPEPLPAPFDETVWWVKCDMVATVGFNRLDLFRDGRAADGKRRYLTSLRVSVEQFEEVKAGVLCGLGMANLLTPRRE